MKNATLKLLRRSVWPIRVDPFGSQVAPTRAAVTTTLLLTSMAVAAQQSSLRFHLPGEAAIVYSDAANPQDPLPERAWKKAVFHFPNGASFGLLPRTGESGDVGGTQMEPPSDGNISPSGQYVVVARDEQGIVSTGPGQPESVLDREYCSMIEVRTGCITADQTGEICGAGWEVGRPAQWGTDEQTDMMLKSDRPSATRQLGFIDAGRPPKLTIRDDSGVDNLLRCDPPSPDNRESYRKIAIALDVAGAHMDARLIDSALSSAGGSATGASAPRAMEAEHRATVSAQKATLYLAPDEAHATRAYLVRNDAVTVLKRLRIGWAYVDYVIHSGKHVLRWIKLDQLAIEP